MSGSLTFWLGVPEAHWVRTDTYVFLSRRRLQRRKSLPVASGPWALDSGGFTELSTHGDWQITMGEYVRLVQRYRNEVGNLAWAAPMDWMCEPKVLAKTGLTVEQHQWRTVTNFMALRQYLGALVIPVLQGWERDDYLRCVDLYARFGVDLADEPLVGLGTVCRRQDTTEGAHIVRALDGLKLHGFGIKTTGLLRYGDGLVSADSMAWSYDARRADPLPGCTHVNCANCILYARDWRARTLEKVTRQGRLTV